MQFFVAPLVFVTMQGFHVLRAMQFGDAPFFMMKRGSGDRLDGLITDDAALLPMREAFFLFFRGRIRPAYAA